MAPYRSSVGALDRATDTLYLYHEHYRSQAEPVVHAEAIRAAERGFRE